MTRYYRFTLNLWFRNDLFFYIYFRKHMYGNFINKESGISSLWVSVLENNMRMRLVINIMQIQGFNNGGRITQRNKSSLNNIDNLIYVNIVLYHTADLNLRTKDNAMAYHIYEGGIETSYLPFILYCRFEFTNKGQYNGISYL